MGSPVQTGSYTSETMVLVDSGGNLLNPSAPVLAAGENNIGSVGGHTFTGRIEKTRPNDTAAYVAGDVINESASAGTPFTLALARTSGPGSGVITNIGLATDDVANLVAFEVDVYEAAPTTALNDNAEGTHLYVDSDKWVDAVLLPVLVKKTTNSLQAEARSPCLVPFKASNGLNLYFRLRVVTGFTPVALKKYKLIVSYAQD